MAETHLNPSAFGSITEFVKYNYLNSANLCLFVKGDILSVGTKTSICKKLRFGVNSLSDASTIYNSLVKGKDTKIPESSYLYPTAEECYNAIISANYMPD